MQHPYHRFEAGPQPQRTMVGHTRNGSYDDLERFVAAREQRPHVQFFSGSQINAGRLRRFVSRRILQSVRNRETRRLLHKPDQFVRLHAGALEDVRPRRGGHRQDGGGSPDGQAAQTRLAAPSRDTAQFDH